MLTVNATDARREWSSMMDTIIYEKPIFVKRTRDTILLTNLDIIETMLSPYVFTARRYVEDDGSITLSLNEIDLVDNDKTDEKALRTLACDIKEYAEDYYEDFKLWSSAKNRKAHLPYVLKVLLMDDIDKIMDLITCQDGKN